MTGTWPASVCGGGKVGRFGQALDGGGRDVAALARRRCSAALCQTLAHRFARSLTLRISEVAERRRSVNDTEDALWLRALGVMTVDGVAFEVEAWSRQRLDELVSSNGIWRGSDHDLSVFYMRPDRHDGRQVVEHVAAGAELAAVIAQHPVRVAVRVDA